jgi:nitroimidazol reductase NimA-like FMN-containing flavoprotein (pyridoxamine 5'-phosphate oxidase superfamily)
VLDIDALIRIQEESYRRAGRGLTSSWPPESAMDADELRSLLDQRRYCVLATTNRDRRAIARPVAYSVLRQSFWFATVGGARLANLKALPWASVVIEDGDAESHRAVAVDGSVTLINPPPPELLDVWERRHGSRADWAAAWFELRPQRLLSFRARH